MFENRDDTATEPAAKKVGRELFEECQVRVCKAAPDDNPQNGEDLGITFTGLNGYESGTTSNPKGDDTAGKATGQGDDGAEPKKQQLRPSEPAQPPGEARNQTSYLLEPIKWTDLPHGPLPIANIPAEEKFKWMLA